jgi:MFS transporter, YNFM family, putative membrane transport protein
MDPRAPDAPPAAVRLQRGTPAFRHATYALGAAGFANFALLYCVQPLLPTFATEFDVAPATASLPLSLTTAVLAPMLIVASSLSDFIGRKSVMVASILATSVLTLIATLMPGFWGLVAIRALVGVAMSGLPAVAMAYLAEELDVRTLGYATGIVIGGNSLGGLTGRVFAGAMADLTSWRLALGVIGLFGLASGLLAWRFLPAARHFRRQRLDAGTLLGGLVGQFGEPGLRWLFALGFLMMGSFAAIYNYLGFRLVAPPYALSQTAASAVFTLYLIGIASSTWMGQLSDRVGRRKVLWVGIVVALVGIAVMLVQPLPLVIVGLAIVTVGFFGAHSVASSWVARRAPRAKAQAASIYLCACYLGQSVMGSLGGFAWSHGGWPGETALLAAAILAAFAISLRLARLQPLQELV